MLRFGYAEYYIYIASKVCGRILGCIIYLNLVLGNVSCMMKINPRNYSIKSVALSKISRYPARLILT